MRENVSHRSWRSWRLGAAAGLLVVVATACSLADVAGTADPPSDLTDPAAMRTPSGAVAAYQSTIAQFATAFGGPEGYIVATGLLSDELQDALYLGVPLAGEPTGLDPRRVPEETNPQLEFGPHVETYSRLHRVRGQAREALGLLRDFAPAASPALRGHLYAMLGYSEVLLAELYCSGIPLSTLDYGADYTPTRGFTTDEVLTHAVALFDSALTLSADSVRIVNLARLGRGRALLALGQMAEAAAAVADVPNDFRYTLSYTAASTANARNFAYSWSGTWPYSVSNREGTNGLDYRDSGDPRTATQSAGFNSNGAALYGPAKYAADGSSPIVLADWVEARLIEAEAALAADNVTTWLGRLNLLRQTAITPPLADTTDPGTPAGRLDLMYRERAFWLFLTGHRQGDLRRLIRYYGRAADQVYPAGPTSGTAQYGSDVTAPIPAAERVSNSLFTGCLSRGA